jgi:glycosyltransferase involved in cell wall biosynthesis
VARILLVAARRPRFVAIDRDLLAERHEVRELIGNRPRPLEVGRAVRWADAIVCWFASWHGLLPLSVGLGLGRTSLLIVGGFDTAALPEIGYGYQQDRLRRPVALACMRLATRLMTNSEYSREELETNTGFDAAVVYHGVPDPFGQLPAGARRRQAVTVSNVARIALERKGLRPFVEAGAHASDVEWVLVGQDVDGAAEELTALAAPNVRLTGRLSDADLDELLRHASVYVQASRHEGFGMGVAEAMLAGCIPVITRAGALPEVVGDAGVTIEAPEPALVAAGVREALELGVDIRRRARERIRERFPLDVRRAGLLALVEELLARDRRA